MFLRLTSCIQIAVNLKMFPLDVSRTSVLNEVGFGNGSRECGTFAIGQVEGWKWTWPRRMKQDPPDVPTKANK